VINKEKWKAIQDAKIAQGKLAHRQLLAYYQTLWQIFLNSFFILSNLKCYRGTFSSSTNHLGNAKPRNQPQKSCKENMFFQIAKNIFFHFDPSYFQTS